MRAVLGVFVSLALLCCAPASPPDAASAQREVSGRELLETMFVENGALSAALKQSLEQSGEEIWDGWSRDAGFATISVERRDAIREYLRNDYPSEATEQILSAAPEMLDAAVPRLSALLSPRQIAEIDAFLRSPEGSSWFVAAAASGNNEYVPSAEEARALDRFAAESGGSVWTEDFNRFVSETVESVVVNRAAAVRHSLFVRVCEIAEDECPPGFVPPE